MSLDMAARDTVGLGLRVLQLLFAVIIMGTDGYGMFEHILLCL